MLQLIGDHLWQSTVCVGVAWLLTLALRRNHASVRFWVWFAASMKFLVPFAVLVSLGTSLPWRPAPIVASNPIGMFELVSQPFSTGVTTAVTAAPAPQRWTLERLATAGLPTIWALGTLVVLGGWLMRWRRIRTAVTAATEDTSSREWQLLSRLAAERGLTPLTLRLSMGTVEPAVVGVRRPVLLWPAGISSRLTSAQVEAILAHELAHIARRDNLLALLHMAAQALFWFHPLVWFVGTRLVHERERACDEDVVRRSGQREAYAEGILRTCEHCVESSLPCAAGVTGADLKARVASIMRGGAQLPVSAAVRALLVLAAIVAIAAPLGLGAFRAPQALPVTAVPASEKHFEVASVRPSAAVDGMMRMRALPGGRVEIENTPLILIIRNAYRVQERQIADAPQWIRSERFDVSAKADGNPTPNDISDRLQALLAERFGLRVHRELRNQPVYALTLARPGQRLEAGLRTTSTDCSALRGTTPPPAETSRGLEACGFRVGPGTVRGVAVSMGALAATLSNQSDRTVQDRTGLNGEFDFDLTYAPDSADVARTAPSAPLPNDKPSLFSALQEQLGLRLEAQIGQVEVLVIDRVERPSDNSETPPKVATTVVAQPQVSAPAQSATQPPTPSVASGRFDVASIKVNKSGGDRRQGFAPGGRFSATMVSLTHLVQVAYTRRPFEERRVEGGPAWRDSVHFDIAAAGSGDYLDAAGFPSKAFAMLKALLVERFSLHAHEESRQVPAYALVLSRPGGQPGPQLKRSEVDCVAFMAARAKGEKWPALQPGQAPPCSFHVPPGAIRGSAITMDSFAQILSTRADRPVVDRTGLVGVFDVELSFAPNPTVQDPDGRPVLSTAVQEQLGLKLEPVTASIEVVVIDHAEMPTEN